MSVPSLAISDTQTGITTADNECASHPSSWQGPPCWLIDSLCWRFSGILKRLELQNILLLWKRHVKSLVAQTFKREPTPPFPRCPCLCLCCSQITFPEWYLTSGGDLFSLLLVLTHNSHQPSWNINWKGKKAVRHFLSLQTKERGARYASISCLYHICCVTFFVLYIRNAKQIAVCWQCFNGEHIQCKSVKLKKSIFPWNTEKVKCQIFYLFLR